MIEQGLWGNPLANPNPRPTNPLPAVQPLAAAVPGAPTFPNGQLAVMGQLPGMQPLGNQTGFRHFDTATGQPVNGNPAGEPRRQAFNQYAANQTDARNRALADRAQALGSAQRLQNVLSGPDANAARTAAAKLTRNPYDAQYLENARGQLKDQRAKQLNAAQQQLIAQYAALGRPVDPTVLAMLNQQVASESNADLRHLLNETTGLGFQADSTAAQQLLALLNTNLQGQSAATDAVYRILANTEYGTGQEDLALLLQLARAN